MVAAVAPALPITDAALSRLAHECARDIYPLEDILRHYKLDPVYFNTYVLNHPRFKLFYAEAHSIWNSSANAKERSALKSIVILDEWLQEAGSLLHKADEPLMAKVKLAELISRLAGLDGDKKQVAPGERVVVNINFGRAGGGVKTIDKVAPTLEGNVTDVSVEP